jgi:pimeloyl-[acyl-carrier protein] methyl ester esterase
MQSPKLVLLHGWGLNRNLWAGVASPRAGITLEAPDLPGYGVAPMLQPYTVDALADWLSAQHSGPCIVLGWSMGGMIALSWAMRSSNQIKGLVLVGTTPCFVDRQDWSWGSAPGAIAEFGMNLRSDCHGTLLRFLSLQARGDSSARAVIASLRACLSTREDPEGSTLAAGLDLLQTTDLRSSIKKIDCPALVLHGGHDALCPPQAGQWLASHLSRARLVIHPKASHAPFLSQKDWFWHEVDQFLDGFQEKS